MTLINSHLTCSNQFRNAYHNYWQSLRLQLLAVITGVYSIRIAECVNQQLVELAALAAKDKRHPFVLARSSDD